MIETTVGVVRNRDLSHSSNVISRLLFLPPVSATLKAYRVVTWNPEVRPLESLLPSLVWCSNNYDVRY